MLKLSRGQAMRHITSALEEMGYAWAYRVVDARAFGLPQRRHRVLMLASRDEDPRTVLFGDDAGEPDPQILPRMPAASTGPKARVDWVGRSTRYRR